MNKRGSFTEALQWIIRVLAATLLMLLLVGQMTMLTDFAKEPHALEMALYRQRLLYGPHGLLAPEAPDARDGRVPHSRFLKENFFATQYQQEEAIFGARIRLYRSIEELVAEEAAAELLHEPGLVADYLPLARAGLTGSGGARYERQTLPIILVTGETERPAWIEVEVLQRE